MVNSHEQSVEIDATPAEGFITLVHDRIVVCSSLVVRKTAESGP